MKVYFEKIYRHMGYLFYAMAAMHRTLSPVEYSRLKDIVEVHWSPAASDNVWLQPILVKKVYEAMDSAFNDHLSGEGAFHHFKDYYTLHQRSFGNFLKQKISDTCHSVAAHFYENNQPAALLTLVEKLLEGKPDLASKAIALT